MLVPLLAALVRPDLLLQHLQVAQLEGMQFSLTIANILVDFAFLQEILSHIFKSFSRKD